MRLTFEPGTAEYVISAFDWELTNRGYIRDEDDIVLSINDNPVHIDELAGIVEYEGEPRPVRDNFGEILDYVKYHQEND